MPHLLLSADLQTPVAAFLRLRKAFGAPAFLFESVEGGKFKGRYSFMGFVPTLRWQCHHGTAWLDDVRTEGNVLQSLRDAITASTPCNTETLPVMAGGLFGHFGFDMIRYSEQLPPPKADPIGLPEANMFRPGLLAIFDHVQDSLLLVAPDYPDLKGDAALLEQAQVALLAPLQDNAAVVSPAVPQSNISRADYDAMLSAAIEYIHAGDIFQVVLSQRFSRPYTAPPFQLYRRLRRLNPSPYLFYVDTGTYALIGSSPEILVRVADQQVTIRPIAGTRPRGATASDDTRLESELLADSKEIAEHLMLLDLGRHDVGRVAAPGSVKVTERFAIERYSHVMHIVSNVEGRLNASHDAVDALFSGFPAGTVSGAPKIRAMEIIHELEPEGRSFYGGAVGYFSSITAMDTCIALRTGVVKDGMLYVQAGGGIVADSETEAEYQETCNKAAALLRAAEG